MNSSARAAFNTLEEEINMLRKALTIILIGGTMAIAACNTVRGAGEDVKSVANCTENTINNGVC